MSSRAQASPWPWFVLPWLLCALLLVGCSGTVGASATDGSGQEGAALSGAAATVLGTTISEQEVADYIQNLRQARQLADDGQWAKYLQDKNTSAEEMRTTAIRELAAAVFFRGKAEELGLSVDEEAVDEQVASMRDSLMAADDDVLDDALESYQTDVETLREKLATKNLQEQVYKAEVDEPVPTQTDIERYVSENLAGQTVKKLVVIYGPDYQYMDKRLKMLRKADSSAAGVEQARGDADDTRMTVEDYGWYFPGSAGTAMQREIDGLSEGDVSDDLLPDSGSYQILYVDDVYAFPDDAGSLVDMPADLQLTVSDMLVPSLWNTACAAWLDEQLDNCVTINDMPAGLSYDV